MLSYMVVFFLTVSYAHSSSEHLSWVEPFHVMPRTRSDASLLVIHEGCCEAIITSDLPGLNSLDFFGC